MQQSYGQRAEQLHNRMEERSAAALAAYGSMPLGCLCSHKDTLP